MLTSVLDHLNQEEIIYLDNLSKDTWNCLDYMWEPLTGLPYDNINKSSDTSVTNIGFTFAVITGAYHLGYIERSDATQRLQRALQSLQSMKRWHGFCQSWNSVLGLTPSTHDRWISTLDTGNMIGGMLMAKNTFHELHDGIDAYIREIDWQWMVDAQNHYLYGGYITDQNAFCGPLTLLGGDPRLACLLAISLGGIEAELWHHLDRNIEQRYGLEYLIPGWQGGGLFMQYIPGLFINEWASSLNRSAANFSFTQIIHALRNRYPVWGWSASDSPDEGYLGWGHIKDDIVTPHASLIAIEHYPKQVLKNLCFLEQLGSRRPYETGGKLLNFGFRDAVNIHTGAQTNNYLYLDQAMIFITLVNFTRNNILRNAVEAETSIVRAKEVIKDYHPLFNEQFRSILHKRDHDPESAQGSRLELYLSAAR
ncbi:MAG: glucoamylase family protein [Chlamydiota bacterium]|nr:glucoamylase family protein [Chlamydiota bacterium]